MKLLLTILKTINSIIEEVTDGPIFNPEVPVLSWAKYELVQVKKAQKEEK